jgi:hypothetical protein
MAPQDTSIVPDSGPTVASRTAMVVGGLVVNAARKLKASVEERTGLPFAVSYREDARTWGATRIDERFTPYPGVHFDDETYTGDAYPAFGWAAAVAEVESSSTRRGDSSVRGRRRRCRPVLRCWPRGRSRAGPAGRRYATIEEIKLHDGRYLNDRLATYLIPTALDAPRIETILVEVPFAGVPHGAKGVGELPMDVGAPAVVAAIHDATGVWIHDLPATPERILAALDGHMAPARASRRSRSPAPAGDARSKAPHGHPSDQRHRVRGRRARHAAPARSRMARADGDQGGAARASGCLPAPTGGAWTTAWCPSGPGRARRAPSGLTDIVWRADPLAAAGGLPATGGAQCRPGMLVAGQALLDRRRTDRASHPRGIAGNLALHGYSRSSKPSPWLRSHRQELDGGRPERFPSHQTRRDAKEHGAESRRSPARPRARARSKRHSKAEAPRPQSKQAPTADANPTVRRTDADAIGDGAPSRDEMSIAFTPGQMAVGGAIVAGLLVFAARLLLGRRRGRG